MRNLLLFKKKHLTFLDWRGVAKKKFNQIKNNDVFNIVQINYRQMLEDLVAVLPVQATGGSLFTAGMASGIGSMTGGIGSGESMTSGIGSMTSGIR
jgi:hypothetical protein